MPFLHVVVVVFVVALGCPTIEEPAEVSAERIAELFVVAGAESEIR